jgi:DDE_Tnp_1-associated
MEPMALSFETLLANLNRTIRQIQDPRQRSNATQYPLRDVILGAFSAFFMQCESFLEHQRQMASRCGRDNAQTLFGLDRVPTNAQIRNVLDKISTAEFRGIFNWVYQALRRGGFLNPYEYLGGHLLVTLDGTQYHSSHKIHCDCCSTRTHKNGTVNYFLSVVMS